MLDSETIRCNNQNYTKNMKNTQELWAYSDTPAKEEGIYSGLKILREILSQKESDRKKANRVIKVFLEQAQNLVKHHIKDAGLDERVEVRFSIEKGNSYFISTQGYIPRENAEKLKKEIERLIYMSPQDITSIYSEKFKTANYEKNQDDRSSFSLTGLGLIEISKFAAIENDKRCICVDLEEERDKNLYRFEMKTLIE